MAMKVAKIQMPAFGHRSHGKGARGAHSLCEVLDVDADGSPDDNASHIEAAHHSMSFSETFAETVGKLERPQKKRKCSGEAVGQQDPLEGLNMLPFRIPGVDEKALVVPKHVDVHESDERKEQVLRPQPGKTSNRHKRSGAMNRCGNC